MVMSVFLKLGRYFGVTSVKRVKQQVLHGSAWFCKLLVELSCCPLLGEVLLRLRH